MNLPALHCAREGAGPDVVLLHGFATNGRVWQPLAALLAGAARLHAPDLPGHGRSSDWPPDAPLPEVAAAVARAVPAGALWVAWSLGALIALSASLQGVAMRGMVLLGATPRFVNGAGWRSGTPQAEWLAFRNAAAARPELLVQRFFGLCGVPGHAGRLTARAMRVALEEGGAPRPEGLALGLALLGGSDLRADLQRIETATLVLHGSADRVVPPAAGRWLSAHVYDGRYLSLRGCGHAPLLGGAAGVLAEAIANWPAPAGHSA